MIYAKPLDFKLVNPSYIATRSKHRIGVIVREDYLQANTQLMQVANTLDLLRSSFRFRNGRKQKRGENCDDGNDHQQFNKRERKTFFIRVQSVFHLWLHRI